MPCNPEELKHVPLFALLDDDETAVLASHVELLQLSWLQSLLPAQPSAHVEPSAQAVSQLEEPAQAMAQLAPPRQVSV